MTALLEVARLSKSYPLGGGRFLAALRDVSFSVRRGELFALLGPSGCGKTTALRCIAGLEKPEGGEIRICGATVSGPGVDVPPERRDLGMVFQSHAVWPHLSVFENVAFPLQVKKLPRARIEAKVAKTLALVGLEGLASRSAALLSGGQQQRVALARALIKEAGLLLFDEPLASLDAALRTQMRGELRALQRRLSATSVYVTHDQEEAMALSDRIAVLAAGELVEVGTPEDLYLRPRTAFAGRFVGQGEVLPCSSATRRGDLVEAATPLGTLFACAPDGPLPERAAVLVRPEHIELLPDGDPAPAVNLLHARVEDAAFLGKLVDYRLDAGGRPLRAQSLLRTRLAPGSQVRVHLPPERCRIVEGEVA